MSDASFVEDIEAACLGRVWLIKQLSDYCAQFNTATLSLPLSVTPSTSHVDVLKAVLFSSPYSDKSCVYMWVWVPVGGTTFLPTSINVFSWYVRQKENLRFEKKTCQLQACTPQGFQQFSY